MATTGLDPRKPYKPLDVGNGIVSGTLAPNGRWLSLGIAHPVHGRVELTTMAPFAGDPFDQRDVRAYRAALASGERPAFGFDVLKGDSQLVTLVEDSFPHAIVERPEGRFEVTTLAPAGRSGAVQLLNVKARANIVGPSWTGFTRLARSEYTQLTRGGALPAPATREQKSVVWPAGWDLTFSLIEDPLLGAAAAITTSPYAQIDAGSEATVIFAIALGRDRSVVEEARELVQDAARLIEDGVESRRRLWEGVDLADVSAAHVRRGLAYAIDCAASRVNDTVAVLADHQILPLVWTRDAYYVCRALLAVGAREPRIVTTVDGFGRWLFERAERVNGWWPRASLASGQAKDPAFQLDQQLWPLLLVADCVRLGADSQVGRYRDACKKSIDALLAMRSGFGLIATAETPADDPLVQPYHFSSHVLLWRVLDAFEHPEAGAVRQATTRHFSSEGRFAYAVSGPDGAGARQYHDANDFPTVFAPGWGFCTTDDQRWRATTAFAWSDANEGYFDGALGGLGSVHTPHPWPLGDLQEIVVARVVGDPERERRANARLDHVETWDGMLPEAYDETGGAVVSRHWFAWPVALRALLESDPMLTAP